MKMPAHWTRWTTAFPGLAAYARNSGWMLAEQATGIACGFVIGVLLTRHLGPADYGVYSLALAVLGLALPVARLGLDTVLVRECLHAEDDAARARLLGAAFALRILAATALIAAAWAACAWEWGGTKGGGLAIAVASLGLWFHSTEISGAYFQAKVRAKVVSLCVLTQLAVSTLLKLWLVLVDADMLAFLWLMVADKALLSALLWLQLRREPVCGFWRRFDPATAARLWRTSWSLIFAGLITVIYARIDQVMLGMIVGPEAVAYYGVGVRLTDLWLVVPLVLTTSLFPALSNARERDAGLYLTRLSQLYAGVMVLGVMVGVCGSLVSREAVTLVFGQDYLPASTVFNIRIWDTFFAALGMIMTRWLHLENLQARLVWFSLAGAIANVGLNFVFIPRFGIAGAAATSVVSVFCVVVVAPALHPATRAHVRILFQAPFVAFRAWLPALQP